MEIYITKKWNEMKETTYLYYLVYRIQTYDIFLCLYDVLKLQNCVVIKFFGLYYTLLLIKKFLRFFIWRWLVVYNIIVLNKIP